MRLSFCRDKRMLLIAGSLKTRYNIHVVLPIPGNREEVFTWKKSSFPDCNIHFPRIRTPGSGLVLKQFIKFFVKQP